MESNSSPAAMPEIWSSASLEPQTLEENSGSNDCEGNVNNEAQKSIRRGRPFGSKNKPKPVIYKDSNDEIMPHVVQVEDGADIAQCLHRFYSSLQVGGLYVMSASGMVADATISIVGSARNIPGISQILSFSGSYLPRGNTLSITMLAPGQVVLSGRVEGMLRAAGPVVIVVGSCVDPSFYRIRPIPPSGEGDGNIGFPGPSYSQATGYTPSVDSSPHNASPNAIDYPPHADDPRPWLLNNPDAPPSL